MFIIWWLQFRPFDYEINIDISLWHNRISQPDGLLKFSWTLCQSNIVTSDYIYPWDFVAFDSAFLHTLKTWFNAFRFIVLQSKICDCHLRFLPIFICNMISWLHCISKTYDSQYFSRTLPQQYTLGNTM